MFVLNKFVDVPIQPTTNLCSQHWYIFHFRAIGLDDEKKKISRRLFLCEIFKQIAKQRYYMFISEVCRSWKRANQELAAESFHHSLQKCWWWFKFSLVSVGSRNLISLFPQMLNYLFHWVIPLRSELKKKMGGNKERNIKTDTHRKTATDKNTAAHNKHKHQTCQRKKILKKDKSYIL